MVGVCNKRRGHGGCTNHPSYGVGGSNNMAECTGHSIYEVYAEGGTVDTYKKRFRRNKCVHEANVVRCGREQKG